MQCSQPWSSAAASAPLVLGEDSQPRGASNPAGMQWKWCCPESSTTPAGFALLPSLLVCPGRKKSQDCCSELCLCSRVLVCSLPWLCGECCSPSTPAEASPAICSGILCSLPGAWVLLGLSWPRGRAVPQLLLLVFGGAGATVSSQGVGYSISLLRRGLKLPQELADGVKKQRPALAVGTQLSSSSSSSSPLVALGELSRAELPQLRGGPPGRLPAPGDSPWCVTSPSSACHPSF